MYNIIIRISIAQMAKSKKPATSSAEAVRFIDNAAVIFYCSSQLGDDELGALTLILNCFRVASSEDWLPLKYADTAL